MIVEGRLKCSSAVETEVLLSHLLVTGVKSQMESIQRGFFTTSDPGYTNATICIIFNYFSIVTQVRFLVCAWREWQADIAVGLRKPAPPFTPLFFRL